MKIGNWQLSLASAVFVLYLSGPVANAAVIDFEGLDTGTIVEKVSSGKGVSGPMSGAIGVFANNPVMESGTNAAVIFDSSCPPVDDEPVCSGGDFDLGTPNQKHGGPGMGIGGAISNDTALKNILIVAEILEDKNNDGLVDHPDDADQRGAYLEFDFSGVENGNVKINSIQYLDIEQQGGEFGANVILSGPEIQTVIIDIPLVGDNGVGVISGIDLAGVSKLRFEMLGSGALASITFNE